jgi:hypothetical protein
MSEIIEVFTDPLITVVIDKESAGVVEVSNSSATVIEVLAGMRGQKGETGAQGVSGTSGREVLLQATTDWVQWQYVGASTWDNLVSLGDITGPQGAQGLQGVAGAASTIAGPQGIQGIQGPAGADSTIAGPQGIQGISGTSGTDGREVLLQATTSYIQWQYVGASTWDNVIAVESLRGPQGISGTSGADGADGAPGAGVAIGGTTGQVLVKASTVDYATAWATIEAGGLSQSQVLARMV